MLELALRQSGPQGARAAAERAAGVAAKEGSSVGTLKARRACQVLLCEGCMLSVPWFKFDVRISG